MSNEIGSRVRYGGRLGGRIMRLGTECVESARVLRGAQGSAEGFRQLASKIQSRAAAIGPQTALSAPGVKSYP
jgi:hypothetical protein